jgi:hypothetical protein
MSLKLDEAPCCLLRWQLSVQANLMAQASFLYCRKSVVEAHFLSADFNLQLETETPR